MTKRAAVVLTVLLGLLVPAAPAAAAGSVALSGRVLDENGRPVAGATVRFSVEVPPGIMDTLGSALGCLFSFGFACDMPEWSTRVVGTGRTDRAGRYVLRFTSARPPRLGAVHDVEVTGPALVRGTLPATTRMSAAYPSGTTLPAFRLWLRGASADAVSPTRRRLRAGVPRALGTPVGPPKVVLVQGTRTTWSYGEVPRDRHVDTRVVEDGTTGTQTTVTTKVGTTYVSYRSGVRPVTRAARPLSRDRRCYGYAGPLIKRSMPGCPLTDGLLADGAERDAGRVVIDLGALSTPVAYVARQCDVYSVAGSVEGEVFFDVDVEERERRVYTGTPDLPVRYVRLDVGSCDPTETSVFGTPYVLPVPPAPVPQVAVPRVPAPPAGPLVPVPLVPVPTLPVRI